MFSFSKALKCRPYIKVDVCQIAYLHALLSKHASYRHSTLHAVVTQRAVPVMRIQHNVNYTTKNKTLLQGLAVFQAVKKND
jgi:hypothetical protein